MIGREPAQNIDDAAAAWAARIDRGLSDGEQCELDAWLGDDARRLGALSRARAIWLHAKHAASLAPLMTMQELEAHPAQRPAILSRRTAMFGGAALAAGLVGAAALPTLLHRPTALKSGVGEIRRVPLGDGSVVTLDTDSRIDVIFTASVRRVRLRSGSAFFEVAADATRPFLVEAGNLVLRAAASAFSVRAIADLPVTIVVSLGQVMLVGATSRPVLTLAANMRATFPTGADSAAVPKLQAVASAEIDRALAWRNGMLAFEGETLGEAAATFRRYGLPAIEIMDPTLARQPITGLFTANDPAGFARAIALSLDARVERGGDVIILTPSRPT